MTFTQSIKSCFKNFITFKGRATRSEYWWFALYYCSLWFGSILLNGSASIVGSLLDIAVFIGCLVSILPFLAVSVRRLHDSNHSGWWYWFCVIPYLGILALTIFQLLRSTPGPNKYGPQQS